jgi:hypothetical protein
MKLPPPIVIIGIAIAVVTLIGLVRTRRNQAASPQFKNTEEKMRYLADSAVDIADKNYGIKLDYSTNSIQKVEDVLGKIHDEFQKDKSVEGIDGMALAFGAYVGEVIQRSETNVKWEQDSVVGGQNSYPLIWNGQSLFVCAWCYKRIMNGSEDNVWFKYCTFKNKS